MDKPFKTSLMGRFIECENTIRVAKFFLVLVPLLPATKRHLHVIYLYENETSSSIPVTIEMINVLAYRR